MSPVPAAPTLPPSIRSDDEAPVVAPVVAPASDEERAREEQAPRRLRALPHAVVPGITGLELEALGVAVLGAKKPPARIVEALDEDGFVEALPAEALAPLAALDEGALEGMVSAWNAELRLTGRRADAPALAAICALARVAVERRAHVLTHIPV